MTPCDSAVHDEEIHELREELETMRRDQLSLIFLCSVATVLCMTISMAAMVLD